MGWIVVAIALAAAVVVVVAVGRRLLSSPDELPPEAPVVAPPVEIGRAHV